MILSLSITLGMLIFLLMLLFALLLFLRFHKSKLIELQKGVQVFKLDLSNRKFKIFNISGKKKNFFGNHFKENSWYSFNDLVNVFKDEKTKMSIFELLHKFEEERSFAELRIETDSLFQKNKKNHFTFTLNRLEDDNDYVLNISWDIVKEKFNIEDKFIFSPNEIVESNAFSKLFIAFKFDKSDLNKSFVEKIEKKMKRRPHYLFSYTGLIFLVVLSKSDSSSKRALKNIRSLFYTKEGRGTFVKMPVDSSYYVSSNVKDLKRFWQALDIAIYLTHLSSVEKIPFKHKDSSFKKENFFEYIKVIKEFRNAIKIDNVGSKLFPITLYSGKTKKANFIFPDVPNISNKEMFNLLSNKNNKEDLIDANIRNISKYPKKSEVFFIDVNYKWVIKRGLPIVYKNFVYIINNETNSVDFEGVYNFFIENKKHSKNLAYRIRKYDPKLLVLIEKKLFNFLIIDYSFWLSDASKELVLVKLATIKKIADQQKIKLIYENAPVFLDQKYIKKIGLSLHYKIK